ncbi:AraC family transcriptional regulator [Jongsikchunia kroppenstedtii]|uniref:AraC family transcriptional regulator n=1 Tax=Jongsikchunia kroppenstedtii TaxID=1121721 RepID=UPI00036AAA78|nr:AraC family transcriptional regulator [Jongsikchunia kroppenstedtii]
MRPDKSGVPSLAFAQLLDNHALDDEADAAFRLIMARDGVDLAALIAKDAPVPLRWFREVFPHLDHTHGFRLGVRCAAQAQLTSFGPLSLPLVSAGSVAEVVELLTFVPLISTALGTEFHQGDRGLVIGLRGRTGDDGLDCFAVTYGGLAVLRLLDKLAATVPRVELHLAFPAPSDEVGAAEMPGRLVFNAQSSFMFVPTDVLEEVCRFADPISYRRGIGELRQVTDARRADSFSDHVRHLLSLNPSRANSAWVAAELAVSTSTLKRHLAAEGTTLRELRKAVLCDRAMVRLLDPTVSITSVATELGFCDVTSFSHAFTRWTGRSPRHYRDYPESRTDPVSDGVTTSS